MSGNRGGFFGVIQRLGRAVGGKSDHSSISPLVDVMSGRGLIELFVSIESSFIAQSHETSLCKKLPHEGMQGAPPYYLRAWAF